MAETGQGVPQPVRIGVLAVAGVRDAGAAWQSTVEYLNRSLPQYRFSLASMPRAALYQAVRRNEVQLFLVDAMGVIQLEDMERLVTRAHCYRGRLTGWTGGTLFCLARRQELQTPASMARQRVGALGSDSLEGWWAVVRHLRAAGAPPTERWTQWFPTAEQLVQAVRDGEIDAGVLPAGQLEGLTVGKAAEFRVFRFDLPPDHERPASMPFALSTEALPNWTLAAALDTPAELSRQVMVTLLNQPLPPAAEQERVQAAGWVPPPSFGPVRACLQALRLPPYEHFGELSAHALLRQVWPWLVGVVGLAGAGVWIGLRQRRANRRLREENARRHIVEHDLHAALKRFEQIARCAGAWIWEADADGRVLFASETVESLLGYRPDEVRGQSLLELMATGEAERWRTSGQHLFGQDKPLRHYRCRFRTREGREAVQEISAEPTYNEFSTLVGYRGVNRDFTVPGSTS